MNSNSNNFIRVQVQKKYFFEFKFEFGKMIEFFRVRVRSPVYNFKLHYCCMLTNRRLQAAKSDKDFKWSLMDCFFAVKSAWLLVTPATLANCYRNTDFVIGYAEELPRAESSSPKVASMPESKLGRL